MAKWSVAINALCPGVLLENHWDIEHVRAVAPKFLLSMLKTHTLVDGNGKTKYVTVKTLLG